MNGRRGVGALAAVALVAVSVPAMATPNGDVLAAALSRTAIAARTDWARYVSAPSSRLVRPVRVIRVSGDVDNAGGLLGRGGGYTTLTYPAGGKPPTLVMDYGQDVSGFVHFGVASVSQPTVLRSAYAEMLSLLTTTGDGEAATTPVLGDSGNPLRYDQFPIAAATSLTSPEIAGAQRYELVTVDRPGTVVLSSAYIEYTPFLGTPNTYRGYFLSDSDLLNKIWYRGVYTVNLNQLPPGTPGHASTPGLDYPIVTDGPKRDRAIWTGDLGVSGHTLFDALGATGRDYVKGSLTVLGNPATVPFVLAPSPGVTQAPGPMPGSCPGPSTRPCNFYSTSYSMFFVIDMYDYYLYTGDAAFVKEHWPVIRRELEWEQQQVDPAGLIATTQATGRDWNTDGHACDCAANSMLHVKSMTDGAALARLVGDTAAAKKYDAQARTAKAAINAHLWNPKMGAYDASTTDRGFLVQDANVWAVLFGVAPPARASQLMLTLTKGLASKYGMWVYPPNAPAEYGVHAVSPFMAAYTMWAYYRTGHPDLAMKLLRTEWGWMLRHDPTGTFWERIRPDGGLAGGPISDSAAHAWSSGPTSTLSEYVLGVHPTKPGFATWQVRPEPSDVRWAQGRVPTPTGGIDSRWERGKNDSTFRLTVSGPPRADGAVCVPLLGAARRIYQDGHLVWDGTRAVYGSRAVRDGDNVRFQATTGPHTWAWAGTA